MPHFRTVLALAAMPMVAPVPFAQSSPWADGELIVRSILPASQTQALYRIEPETGHGEELLSGFFWPGYPSSFAFDPYRSKLIANIGIAPVLQFPASWLIDSEGALTALPQLDGEFLRAVTPIGDGRIYYQRVLANPNGELNYLDANDNVHTLMDDTGSAPFDFITERMLYHAPTNSLIAATSSGAINSCSPTGSSLFRIPLSADGSRVVGPVSCGSLPGPGSVLGIDYLPGGDLLVQMTGGQFFTETTQRVDANTFASTTWAQPQPIDIDGGLWCARIGRAVVLDDANNLLRTYSEGQAGSGTVLTTDVPVSAPTSGVSATDSMIEVDLFDTGCAGVNHSYGAGLAGTGDVTPTISALGCADVGNLYTVRIEEVVGGGLGVLAVGFTPIEAPLFGGVLHVLPAFTVLVSADGPAGAAGAGAIELTHTFGSPSFTGLEVYFQAGFVDFSGPEGVSLTNALLIVVG